METYEIRFWEVILGVLIEEPRMLDPEIKIPLWKKVINIVKLTVKLQ